MSGDNKQVPKPRQGGDDVFREAVSEVFLIRVAAHILEGQHGNRRSVGKCRTQVRGSPFGVYLHSIDPYWPCDVFELLLAQILESEIQLATRVLQDAAGYTNA